MVSVLASSRSWLQTNEYKMGICCFSTKHATLRSKNKDWLSRNQNNVSKWSDMSTRGLLLQWASTIKNPTQRVGLDQSGHHPHFIGNNFFLWYRWKIAHLALNNNHSLTPMKYLWWYEWYCVENIKGLIRSNLYLCSMLYRMTLQ